MAVRLYHELDNNSMYPLEIEGDLPVMPNDWDRNTLTCQIDQRSIPCRFFSEPLFRGQQLTLVQGGGCGDLDRLPGQWRNKIRSVAMGSGLKRNADSEEVALSDPRIEEAKQNSAFAHLFGDPAVNPAIADAGCIWATGKRTAFMRYGPPNAPLGARLSIIVLQPQYAQFCQGGRTAQNEDLSMILESYTYDPMNPFAQLALTGRPV